MFENLRKLDLTGTLLTIQPPSQFLISCPFNLQMTFTTLESTMSLNSDLVNDLWCVLHVVLSQLIMNGVLEQRVVAVVYVFPGRAGEHVPQGIVKHTTVLPILHALSHNAPQGEHQGVLLPHMGVQIGNLFQ